MCIDNNKLINIINCTGKEKPTTTWIKQRCRDDVGRRLKIRIEKCLPREVWRRNLLLDCSSWLFAFYVNPLYTGVACIGSGRLSNSIVHHLVEVDELRPMCSFMAASLGQITCGIVDAAKLAEHDWKSISLADELTRTWQIIRGRQSLTRKKVVTSIRYTQRMTNGS